MSGTVTFFAPVSRTVTATVVCGHCTWSAVHTADNAIEVSSFLRGLLIRHVTERHPEIVPPAPPPFPPNRAIWEGDLP
jgi:hypothetical protein